ncbi:MAG: DUF4982 domain-containing protein [Calditrichaceae bacterium]|nr:DUF4982 domain-containing protein [Calditrichaceae bacterium]MBN2708255.1 DUF4982 domain-containing protein [Calditrichaceae bacterium]RQV92276.1 MAG: DUF4982 domain-containing protein [Calditrichota bacterium]
MSYYLTVIIKKSILLLATIVIMGLFLYCSVSYNSPQVRITESFNTDWKFYPGDVAGGFNPSLDDSDWRVLNLPHDWSIESVFSETHPAGVGGGALPGGIGWYRKNFYVPEQEKEKSIFIEFDGVYQNSEVWINGNYLGKRPYGYSSFRYELTPFLNYGQQKNVITVKIDNSQQPNSRWYSGSGIYRHVRLVKTNKIRVAHWGTFITTSDVSEKQANVILKTKIENVTDNDSEITINTTIYDHKNKQRGRINTAAIVPKDTLVEIEQRLIIDNPVLWSDDHPNLYRAITTIEKNNEIIDNYSTIFGIRFFNFNANKGFFLNGRPVKIRGICMHHDLGCLGAAVNTRALERQLELLKEMGCNGIRTSHNPPAPELLDLCDRMGFIVMDEAFDMWEREKTKFDYHLHFKEWHERDLQDLILRDRNHPSVFMWSIGNEIVEQWFKEDITGEDIAGKLKAIVTKLDTTRPVTAACNDVSPENPIIRSGALDIIGYNYSHNKYSEFQKTYPGQVLIASETESALATRGSYDMPSDSIRRWPEAWDKPFLEGNKDYTCSSYDNCSAPWGSTHEETWSLIKNMDFVSGMYIWTGFDYLGEPTPYGWPARSSYFGIIDLAGFPKDAYYLYQSEWTDKPVLHIFPHWNWKEGELIDIWAYTNCDEVELFLNGKSLGIKKKEPDVYHLCWRLNFKPGTLKAIGRLKNGEILTKEIKTAGLPAKIILEADRKIINADGTDLSFITIKIADADNHLVPDANNTVEFKINGVGALIGVDNGLQTSHESFKSDYRKAFNGRCLAVIQSSRQKGDIILEVKSDGLERNTIKIETH